MNYAARKRRIGGGLLIVCGLWLSDPASAEETIAFCRLGVLDYWQIWVMSSGGANQRQLTHSKVDKRDPAWIDSQRIGYRTNDGRLFIFDKRTDEETQILEQYRIINNPNFAADGTTVVFVRFDPASIDSSDIWKVHLDTRKAMLLTRDRGLKYQPVLSPDETMVVFVRADTADRRSHNLWSMRSDGTEQRQLTFSQSLNTLPVFSPDQRTIAFTSNRNEQDYEIYILELANGEVRQMTSQPGLDTNPTYSPSGDRIAWVSNRSGSQQIWALSVKQPGRTVQLTHGEADSIDPAWIGADR